MKKPAAFLVQYRIIVLAVFAALSILSALMIGRVNINYDTIVYMPDDAGTKQGVERMRQDFPETTVLRVMFRGLGEDEKESVKARLEAFPRVDQVVADLDDDAYDHDGYTLYEVAILGGSWDKSSAETYRAIRDAFPEGTADAAAIDSSAGSPPANDPSADSTPAADRTADASSGGDQSASGLSAGDRSVLISGPVVDNVRSDERLSLITAMALLILVVILFVMSSSWVEPFLFMLTIGMAIVLNMGTNALLPSVSNTTASIASILQLVLSMDYSIMLIDRYRQDRLVHPDKEEAMRNALSGGFLAIAGSSVTTVVGLLCLVFMSFTIGLDMGVVLAKGVVISLVCILCVMPGLMLVFDRAIAATRKPTPVFRMKRLAAFQHRFRFVVLALALVLLVGGYLLKDSLRISYSLVTANADDAKIDAQFPPTNPLLVVYDTADEAAAAETIADIEALPGTAEVNAYANTLGKPYTSAALAEEMAGETDSGDLNAESLDILYYDYFKEGRTGTIGMTDFLNFLLTEVRANDRFAEEMDADARDQLDRLEPFTTAEGLRAPKTAAVLAEELDMDAEDVLDLYLYRYSEAEKTDGGRNAASASPDPGSMTLAEFVGFLRTDILTNEDFSDRIDPDVADEIDTLAVFADPAEVVRPMSAVEMADMLDMKAGDMKKLFAVWQDRSGTAAADRMTLQAFVAYLREEVLSDPELADSFDADIVDELDRLALLADPVAADRPMDLASLADLLQMDKSDLTTLVAFYNSRNSGAAAGAFSSGTSAGDLASGTPATGITAGAPPAPSGTPTPMTLAAFVRFLRADILTDPEMADSFDPDVLDELDRLEVFADAAAVDRPMGIDEMAGLLDMTPEDLRDLFLFRYTEKGGVEPGAMTADAFVRLVLDDVSKNPDFSDEFTKADLDGLRTLSAFANPDEATRQRTPEAIAKKLDMDADAVRMIFLHRLYSRAEIDTDGMSMTMQDFLVYVIANFEESMGDQVERMSQLLPFADPEAIARPLPAAALAAMFGMGESEAAQLMAGWDMMLGDGDGAIDALSPHEFASFAAMLSPDSAQLAQLVSIMDAAAAGTRFDSVGMGRILGVRENAAQIDLLYALRFGDLEDRTLSLKDFVGYILSDLSKDDAFADSFDDEALEDLRTLRRLMNGAVENRAWTPAELAALLDMKAGDLEDLYLYRISRHGDTSGWKLSLRELVSFILTDVVTNPDYADRIDAADIDGLRDVRTMMDGAAAGRIYGADALADLLGMDASDMRTLYWHRVALHGDTSGWRLALRPLAAFLTDEVLADPDYAGRFSAQDAADLTRLRAMVDGAAAGRAYGAKELAALLDMDAGDMNLLYLTRTAAHGDASGWRLSLRGFVDFVLEDLAVDADFADRFTAQDLADMRKIRDLMQGAVDGAAYTPQSLSARLDMDEEDLRAMFLYRIREHGDTSGWTLSLDDFVSFILSDVATDPEYADEFDAGTLKDLRMLRTIMDGVLGGESYGAKEMATLMAPMSDKMDEDAMSLMYLYWYSLHGGESGWTIPIGDFIRHLADDVLTDPRFADYFDDETRADLLDAKAEIEEGRAQLVGPTVSRMIVRTSLKTESKEMAAYIGNLEGTLKAGLSDRFRVVGDAAVAAEMQERFQDEFNFISLLTALAVFLVVVVTFRKLALPALLVLLIQSATYVTMGITYLQGESFYYLALMIVQSILMGATIDYAILFTDYYRDLRKKTGIAEAIAGAYAGSMGTIMTSASILVLVTLTVGLIMSDPTVSQVCLALAKGSFISLTLVLLVLPGLLAACDRVVVDRMTAVAPQVTAAGTAMAAGAAVVAPKASGMAAAAPKAAGSAAVVHKASGMAAAASKASGTAAVAQKAMSTAAAAPKASDEPVV